MALYYAGKCQKCEKPTQHRTGYCPPCRRVKCEQCGLTTTRMLDVKSKLCALCIRLNKAKAIRDAT